MAMDTVTGYWSDERPAWGSRHRAEVLRRESPLHEPGHDVHPGGGQTVSPPHRSAVRAGTRRGPAVCVGSHAPDPHGSRLTPRGRVVVALVWLAMAAAAGLMLATVPGDGTQEATMTTKVMVEPGETLWQLAGEVQPGADRHETVATIMSLNDLDSASQVRPGDILVVPVEP